MAVLHTLATSLAKVVAWTDGALDYVFDGMLSLALCIWGLRAAMLFPRLFDAALDAMWALIWFVWDLRVALATLRLFVAVALALVAIVYVAAGVAGLMVAAGLLALAIPPCLG